MNFGNQNNFLLFQQLSSLIVWMTLERLIHVQQSWHFFNAEKDVIKNPEALFLMQVPIETGFNF